MRFNVQHVSQRAFMQKKSELFQKKFVQKCLFEKDIILRKHLIELFFRIVGKMFVLKKTAGKEWLIIFIRMVEIKPDSEIKVIDTKSWICLDFNFEVALAE
jgi:hypothetical protein